MSRLGFDGSEKEGDVFVIWALLNDSTEKGEDLPQSTQSPQRFQGIFFGLSAFSGVRRRSIRRVMNTSNLSILCYCGAAGTQAIVKSALCWA